MPSVNSLHLDEIDTTIAPETPTAATGDQGDRGDDYDDDDSDADSNVIRPDFELLA